MHGRNGRPLNHRRARSAGWLALLSLAFLQISLASHQFEHDSTWFLNSCHVCVQLDRSDDSVSGHLPPAEPLMVAHFDAPQPAVQVVALDVIRHANPRAPPQL